MNATTDYEIHYFQESGTRGDMFDELGSLDRVPYTMSPEPWSDESDPGRAFVVGLVDGESTIESIVRTSTLPMHRALYMLADLLRDGAIALH